MVGSRTCEQDLVSGSSGRREYIHPTFGLTIKYKSITDSSGQLPGGKRYGHSFSSYIINAPNYLAYLGRTVRDMGIPIHRTRLASLDSAFDLKCTGKTPLVVNATGLGARSLIGVEDPDVYPARGQTVLVRAPEVSRCIMHVEGFMAAPPKDGEGEFCFYLMGQ